MENSRKHVNIRAVNQWSGRYGAEACIASPDFHSIARIGDDMAIIQMKVTTVKIEKPIYVGLSVLDISKTLMYDFHYNKMKKWVGSKCKLLYLSLIHISEPTRPY